MQGGQSAACPPLPQRAKSGDAAGMREERLCPLYALPPPLLLPPRHPIDILAAHQLQLPRLRNAVRKQRQIIPRELCARHQQSVKLEEVRGSRDGLRRIVIEGLIAGGIERQASQARAGRRGAAGVPS